MTARVTLRINADDAGLHPDIDDAVNRCVEQRQINSVSVVNNAAYADYEKIRKWSRAGIFTGAHITFTQLPWLTQKKQCRGWAELAAESITRPRALLDELRVEMYAQYERMIQSEISVDHLDSHQHVHMLPLLFPLFVNFCKENNIPELRIPAGKNICSARRNPAGLVLHLLSVAKQKNRIRYCAGIRCSGHNTAEILKKEIAALQGSKLEIILHPALPGRIQDDLKNWNYKWEDEYEMIQSGKLNDALRDFYPELKFKNDRNDADQNG